MHEPPETSELQTFATAVAAGSLSRAARELGVPRPTVSRRLQRLEEKLGVRLLRRTTRAMALTDAGELLYARTRIVLAAVRDAVASVQKSDDVARGLLRVSVPPLGGSGIGPMIAGFLGQHPGVRIELYASTAHVDLVADGYDVAIRATSELPAGLIARNLARTRIVGVASPAYLARAGAPRRTTELSKHACLAGFTRGTHPATEWPLVRGGTVRIDATLATNDIGVLCDAARAGLGIALLPLLMVYDDLASGALVAVLPEVLGTETRVAVVYADREFVAPALRAFIDAVIGWARDDPTMSQKLPECPTPKARRAKRRQVKGPRQQR